MSSTTNNGFDKSQEIILAVTPVVPAILSFAASATIIVMIYRSPTKFANPFRRIFFGMCVFDLLQSIGTAITTLPAPADESDAWGAIGNQGTCIAQGILVQVRLLSLVDTSHVMSIDMNVFEDPRFSLNQDFISNVTIFQTGNVGSAFYSTILATFYLSTITFKITPAKFARYEKWLHIITNLLLWPSTFYLAATGNFNFLWPFCWTNPYPNDCLNNPDVDCIRG